METLNLTHRHGGDVMSEIKAIILVPAEGDPHGLLREGPCGARPPMALSWSDTTNRRRWSACGSADVPRTPSCRMYDPGEALVLAWDGKAVMEGCDRADWAAVGTTPAPHHSVRDAWATVFPLMDHPEDTHVTVGFLCGLCSELGTIILLDADGKEIK